MKIDRLLGITIYLLNHKKATAQQLAEHFEVSQRTILRDMNTLCMAGIPVASTFGADGGFEILDTFKMERCIAGNNDYAYIVTALQGFASAYENKELDSTLERIEQVSKGSTSNVILDFGVLQEHQAINEKLRCLDEAIKQEHVVRFDYTNAEQVQKQFETEPVAAMYKWYNWYLLCYYPKYEDYRIFKLCRMEHIEITEHCNSRKHNAKEAKEKWELQEDTRECTTIRLQAPGELKTSIQEYLSCSIESVLENGDIIFTTSLPKNEKFWYGSLLSFGAKVKVLEPEELKKKLCSSCEEILKLYE